MSRSFADILSDFAGQLGSTLKSCVKLSISARSASLPHDGGSGMPLVILGNGPSLRRNLAEDMHLLRQLPCMAVNFFANAPEFRQMQPRYYILADPHFFRNASTDENVARLIENIRSVTWDMTLLLPARAKGAADLFKGSRVKTARFNFLAAEGFRWFEDFAFSHNLAMPRPRNVLIPALMTGIAMGYRQIYLLGADHSWLSTLAVADDNTVISVQPHFYSENDREQARVNSVYRGIRLHSVLESMMIAFRSYHTIERYARSRGIEIFNATPGSMIDAFIRRTLPAPDKKSEYPAGDTASDPDNDNT